MSTSMPCHRASQKSFLPCPFHGFFGCWLMYNALSATWVRLRFHPCTHDADRLSLGDYGQGIVEVRGKYDSRLRASSQRMGSLG